MSMHKLVARVVIGLVSLVAGSSIAFVAFIWGAVSESSRVYTEVARELSEVANLERASLEFCSQHQRIPTTQETVTLLKKHGGLRNFADVRGDRVRFYSGPAERREMLVATYDGSGALIVTMEREK